MQGLMKVQMRKLLLYTIQPYEKYMQYVALLQYYYSFYQNTELAVQTHYE